MLLMASSLGSTPVLRAESDLQAWQWLTVDLYQNQEWKLYLYADNRIGNDVTKFYAQILSPRIRYQAHEHLDLQVGYAYLRFDPLSGADDFHQDRAELEVNPKTRLGPWMLHSRNRLELRWVDGQGRRLPRIRNRLQVTYRLGHRWMKHVYANNEICWNPDSGRWLENRLIPFGLGFQLTERTTLNLFYLWQYVERPKERFNAHVIGTFFQTGF